MNRAGYAQVNSSKLMMKYIKLLRIKHYIKNFLIFIPAFFARNLFDRSMLMSAVIGFFAFSFTSSAVYIINDIRDVEKDRIHPVKKMRPIASGEISKKTAMLIFYIMLFFSLFLTIGIGSAAGAVCLVSYFVINIGYSAGLKDVQLLDIALLSSGFVIRVLYGGIITDTVISPWLFMVVLSGSLFMAFGKRRGEMFLIGDQRREVVDKYGSAFLNQIPYVCISLCVIYYSLWTIERERLIWTVPLVLFIIFKYILDIEQKESDGDPVSVILGDKVLISMCIVFIGIVAVILYIL